MITELDPITADRIKNQKFAAYASIYNLIYADYIEGLEQKGVEFEQDTQEDAKDRILKRIKQKGAKFRNNRNSIFVNAISPACKACRKGVGSATFFISLKCHRTCFYCFNPNQENYALFTTKQRDLTQEIEQIFKSGQQVSHIALTGGEPLLHEDEAVDFFYQANSIFPEAHKRIYTCGDHITVDNLQAMRDAGLDEIRFSIRTHDLDKGHDDTFDQIALAKDYIPQVMVEMPVLPGTLETMQRVLLRLDELEIDSINLLEFCYPLGDWAPFKERGYKIKARPYRVLYNYWYAGGLPVAESEMECLSLIEFALDQDLNIGVHYCSLENKHSGQIYQQNFNQEIPGTAHLSEKDFFIKTAKVFGDDQPIVENRLKKAGYHDYVIYEQHDFLEFHVGKLKALKGLEIEVGISYNVLEQRGNDTMLRELKIDLTSPDKFNPGQDL